jgi:hypothetical protein
MRKIFLIFIIFLYAKESEAITYSVSQKYELYIEHPNAGISDSAPHGRDGAQGYAYADQIRLLRNALTVSMPVGYVPRITNNVEREDVSLVRVMRLDVNNNLLPPIDLVVRTQDLYVIGFINGPTQRRVVHRFDEPQPHIGASASTASQSPDWTLEGLNDTWHHAVRNLDLSYDYPVLESFAHQSRYGDNIRISHGSLYAAFGYLDQLDQLDIASRQEFSRHMLRVLIGYFEAVRFQSISERLEQAFSQRQTWIVDRNSAILTNNWAHLSRFSSETSLNNDQQRTFMPSSGFSSLSYPLINAWASVNNAIPLRNVLAVTLGSQWRAFRRASCSDLSPSKFGRRLLAIDENSNNQCSKLLMVLGSKYFDVKKGYAFLSIF